MVDAVSIPVLANGDIVEPADALEMLDATGAAGVMIGRGAMRNPWLFSQISELDCGRRPPQPTGAERAELVERHMQLMLEYFKERRSAVHMLKKYLCAYATGMHGAVEFRDRVNRSNELDAVVSDARSFFREAA